MDKSDRKKELEQLKKRIDNSRKALSSLKAENMTAEDAQLKKRVIAIEKSIKQINGQVKEMAKQVDEGMAYLMKEVKELKENSIRNESGKNEYTKPQRLEMAAYEALNDSRVVSELDAPASNSSGAVPTFKQLKQLAQQANFQTNELPKYNSRRYGVPDVRTTFQGSDEAIIPLEHDPASTRKNEQKNSTSSKGQSEQTQMNTMDTRRVVSDNRLNKEDRAQDSPFRRMFKKK